MRFEEFVGQVQSRTRLEDTVPAVKAIRATLETLGEGLPDAHVTGLAGQLPREIGDFLLQPNYLNDRIDLDEYFERVALRADLHVAEARRHAQAVISVLCESISPRDIRCVRAFLPLEYGCLFESQASAIAWKRHGLAWRRS